MPVITDIKESKKKFLLYLDNIYCCTLAGEIVLRYGLTKGKELPLEKLEEVQREGLARDLFNYALRLLSFQNRTTAEIELRLLKRTTSQTLVNDIIEKLKGYNFIDSDERYMQKMLEARPGHGVYYFLQKFTQKGIEKKCAQDMLREFFAGGKEAEYAEILLLSQKNKLGKLDKLKKGKRIASLLKSRGFSSEVIYDQFRKAGVNEVDSQP